MHDILLAFALTLIAGLSTGVGSLIALLARRTDRRFLSVSLGFSAGVMIYVSMVELLDTARESLTAELGARGGAWATVAAFFGGMLFIAIIDKLIPAEENPHEVRLVEGKTAPGPQKLMRTGVLTALAIAVHNFPEGLATFVSALQAPNVAVPIVRGHRHPQTSPRASPYPCPSIRPRGPGARRSAGRSSRALPSRRGRWWAICC